jgi:hypothetical protein
MGELQRLKGARPPLVEDIPREATLDEIELPAVMQFLGSLGLPRPAQTYLEPEARVFPEVPSLVTAMPDIAGVPREHPRNFTLLLFGPVPERHLRGAYVVVTKYHGTTRRCQAGRHG